MKIEETTNEGLRRAYAVTIPAKDIDAAIEAEVKKIAPQVRMPGFRPGKVPSNLVKKMHGEAIHGQVVNEQIQSAVPSASNVILVNGNDADSWLLQVLGSHGWIEQTVPTSDEPRVRLFTRAQS